MRIGDEEKCGGRDQEDAGDDGEDRAVVPGRDRAGPGGGGEDEDAGDPHHRPAQEALPAATKAA